ncbi:unnamed protein product [Auanema sp. JU1783]|nr:unnamed protein product [Auanema sp. JU1783]
MDFVDANSGPFKAASLEAVKLLEQGDVRDVNPDEQCNICMDCYGTYESVRTSPYATVLKMPCNHVFHSRCLHSWLKKANTCPTCRHELPAEENDIAGEAPDDDVLNSFLRSHERVGLSDILQIFSSPSSERPRAEMRDQPTGMYI